jgi:4-amino-4-deoxy-L-arabinose transferase-like glycosyltransferase
MELEDTPPPKQSHFALLLFLSFLVTVFGWTFEQTIQWSNHLEGFFSGLLQGAIFGLGWCLIYVLPWILIISGLYRWRRWRRFRTHWILAPSILIATALIGSLFVSPPTPENRFQRFAKAELPANAQDLHFHFSGGGMADYSDTYYFKTTPSEVDRIIHDMGLELDEVLDSEGRPYTVVKALPECPDFSTWKGAAQYRGWDEREHWFYYLITDSSKTQVYMMIGCI